MRFLFWSLFFPMEVEFVLAIAGFIVLYLLYFVWKKFGDNEKILDTVLGRRDERSLVDIVLGWQLVTEETNGDEIVDDDEKESTKSKMMDDFNNIERVMDKIFGGGEESESVDETSDENLIFGMVAK
jgi:hypothetical protein